MKKIAVAYTIFCIYFTASMTSILIPQVFAAQENDWLEVIQTDAGYFINSITPNGNLSFMFEFAGKELSTVAFINNTGHYAIEYILPVEVWEYEDMNGNGYFDSTYIEWISGQANETVFAYYKNFWFSEITNITTFSDDMGNVVCGWLIKGFAGQAEPWPEEEVLVPIKYAFHYFPLNGTLKTDFGIENFTQKNGTSRLFIEFSMRYASMKDEDVKLITNGQKLDINLINDHYKINSTTILLVVNDDVKGFFDFGGRCEIDNSTTTPIGVIVPWIERGYHVFPPTYGYSTEIGIQLCYPHVEKTLNHDPSFGLASYKSPPKEELTASPKTESELSWKTPLIAGTIALLTIIATISIFRRKKPRSLDFRA